jgi:sialidase-1
MRTIAPAILVAIAVMFAGCHARPPAEAAGTLPGAKAIAMSVPVLKGLPQNPVQHIELDIPPGFEGGVLESLTCELGDGSPALVSEVGLWRTDTADFVRPTRIATAAVRGRTLTVRSDEALRPGRHHLWVTLDPSARCVAGDRIRFGCASIRIRRPGSKASAIRFEGSLRTHPVGSVVRRAGDDGVHTYRIPGIVSTDKGTLLAVYDIRYRNSRDLPGDVDVGLSRSTDGGRTWSPMKVIMDMGAPHENNGIGDPAILFDPVTKRVWVAALWSKGNRSIAGSKPGLSPDTTGQFVLAYSDDDGLSWSMPYSITPQVKDPAWHLFFQGPGNGIALQDGRLVFAAQYWDEQRMPWSTIIHSADHGASWKGSIRGPKSNTTEAQVVETTPGTLMLNMRDNRRGSRSVAVTNDFGASWTEHPTSRTALPEPVCMASLIRARVNVSGTMRDVLFFSNPLSTKARLDMTVQASSDLGETWPQAHRLLVDQRPCYGYSSLVQIDAETIGLLYEGSGDLYFVPIPVSEVVK